MLTFFERSSLVHQLANKDFEKLRCTVRLLKHNRYFNICFPSIRFG